MHYYGDTAEKNLSLEFMLSKIQLSISRAQLGLQNAAEENTLERSLQLPVT